MTIVKIENPKERRKAARRQLAAALADFNTIKSSVEVTAIMQLKGNLENRDAWATHGVCPIEKTMNVVGSRNAMLIMREAFYGTTRFEDFGHRVGMSEATTASNLKALVAAGLLTRTSYKVEGQRSRLKYILTEAGRDLMPVVVGLFNWGVKHAAESPPLEIVHDDCGSRAELQMACEAGHRVNMQELELRPAARRGSRSGDGSADRSSALA